jgi:hypothetical protein
LRGGSRGSETKERKYTGKRMEKTKKGKNETQKERIAGAEPQGR